MAIGTESLAGQSLIASATALQPLVRHLQQEIERERRLPPRLVDVLREAGLYRMLTHHELGGLEVDLLSCFRVVEVMAEADGSVGWNLMNNAVQHLAILSLPVDGVEEIYAAGPDQIIAGTLVPGGGRGVRVDGGYLVTGRWRFGSGCRESQWMMGNFTVADQAEEGVFRVVFPARECTVVETWDMTGMLGTGSHDWSVDQTFVPERRVVFVPGGTAGNQWSHWSGTLCALPIHAIIGPHHSFVATGLAHAAIEAFCDLAGAKVPRGRSGLLRDHEHIQDWVARAEAVLSGGRAFRTEILTDVWNTVARGDETSLVQRARCRLAGSHAADCSRQAIDYVFRAGGTTSTQRTHRLAHCWRDLQVVSNAASLNPEWYPIAGRVLLGVDPGPRLS